MCVCRERDGFLFQRSVRKKKNISCHLVVENKPIPFNGRATWPFHQKKTNEFINIVESCSCKLHSG